MSLARPNPRFLARTNRIFASQTRSYAAPGDGTIPAAKKKYIPSTGTYPLGFKAGSAHVGVKASNTRFDDLALIASDAPCAGAAVFTTNKFQAAPVTVSRDLLKSRKGEGIRSVIINSGCANAVTGKGGIEDAKLMGRETDQAFVKDSNGEDDGQSRSIVMSTGVIGQRLPIQKIISKIPTVYYNLGETHEHWLGTAKAICTTDTFPKGSYAEAEIEGYKVRIAGIAKGSGMIAPDMATMLGFVFTDAAVDPAFLQTMLAEANRSSFSCITVDSDTSTSDTVLAFATGKAGNAPLASYDDPGADAFQAALTDLCTRLAHLVVRDGEGATKFVEVRVAGAASVEDARLAARSIAGSNLLKAAVLGADPNWGRIACAAGYSGAALDPDRLDVTIGDVRVVQNGLAMRYDQEAASAEMRGPEVRFAVDLNLGAGAATAFSDAAALSRNDSERRLLLRRAEEISQAM